MDLPRFVTSVLHALPGKRVEGKKRFQKLAYLLKAAGVEVPATFGLLHFGPYSRQLAHELDVQSVMGAISEAEEPVGTYGQYMSVYTLVSSGGAEEPLSEEARAILSDIDKYSTVELEVASTIAFFQYQEGNSRAEAIKKTKQMKPNKTVQSVLNKAEKILSRIEPQKYD